MCFNCYFLKCEEIYLIKFDNNGKFINQIITKKIKLDETDDILHQIKLLIKEKKEEQIRIKEKKEEQIRVKAEKDNLERDKVIKNLIKEMDINLKRKEMERIKRDKIKLKRIRKEKKELDVLKLKIISQDDYKKLRILG